MSGTSIPRRVAAFAVIAALAIAACSGGTSSSAPSAAPAASAAGESPAASGGTPSAPASAAAVGYQGPEATIEYAIWGDPTELKNQQAIVDAFHAAEPKITVKVTVSDWDTYWDKLQTGLAGGAAPDVFAMDGPLFPDYASRDVLLDLSPYIQGEGYDLTTLDDNAVRDFTMPDRRQMGLPRDLNDIALFYNKTMFDKAGIPYPDDTWDWAKLSEVGKQLTLDTNGDGKTDQWGLYTETTDMENYWSSLVWQNGGDILAPDGKTTVLDTPEAAGGLQRLQDLIWKEKIVPDPALFVETGDAFEQGKAAMEINGSWLVATDEAAGLDFGIAPLPKGPAGAATSVNPTGAVVYLTIPRELADAARVDGANPWQIYRHIYLPLSKPALATLAIFTFMWSWNDLIDPLIYLRDLPTYTVTVGLAFFKGQFVGKWPEMMAGALVSLAPMIILFILAQRHFVRGITLTGIKG